MFWQLLLAHFIADFPLQPGWMVREKIRFWVLFFHAGIHLIIMFLVTLPVSARLWPYLVGVSLIHFCIDSVKNWFSCHRPQWRAWPYVIDQVFHILSIGLVSSIIVQSAYAEKGLLSRPAAITACGFLLVTFVFMVSERVLLSGAPFYPLGTNRQIWFRLFGRAALLGLVLTGWNVYSVSTSAPAIVLPYPTNRTGLRVFIMDLSITLFVALLVIFMIGS